MIEEESIKMFKCDQCGGYGYVTIPDHAPDCQGYCKNCPILVQIPCDKCGGAGGYPVPPGLK